MKQNDIFSALSFVDDELTARAHKTMQGEHKYKKIAAWKRWSMVAACVCLCVAILAVSMPKRAPGINYDISPTHTVDSQSMSQLPKQTYLCDEMDNLGIMTGPGSSFNYIRGTAIVAKVVEVLPDEYSDPALTQMYEKKGVFTFSYDLAHSWKKDLDFKFHILRLRVERVINGENIPHEIYYMLPSYASTDLLEYDQMIFFVRLQGYDQYVLMNETQGRAEAFYPMFVSNKWTNPYSHVGSILAFSNGRLDTGLWEKEGWLVPYDNMNFWDGYTLQDFLKKNDDSILASPTAYPAYEGCTLRGAIRMIQKYQQELKDNSTEYNFNVFDRPLTSKVQAALSYVKPFENGIFAHNSGEIGVRYFRVIHGFFTREEIEIDYKTGEVYYSGEPFTQQDIDNLPDLSVFLSQLDLTTLDTGHLTPEVAANLQVNFCRTTAWYTKYNGQAYGVVKVHWQYIEIDIAPDVQGYPDRYYDDLYYLFSTDGEVKVVSREELREYIGDDGEIESFEYNVPQNSYRGYN